MGAKEIEKIALNIRRNLVKTLANSGSGHPGGCLSAVDILSVLYFEIMNVDPQNPRWEDRDRFILSKGHASAALYSTLVEKGFFPEEWLLTYGSIDSKLQGHVDMIKTPGVEMSSGSLGQGLSVGVGMSFGAKLKGKDFKTYVMIGDGESQEGQIWEAVMAAAQYKLDNLRAIFDYNRIQCFSRLEDVISMDPVDKKFQSFGWHTIEIDGHDIEEIISAFKAADQVKEKPTVIIANTIKGKGISFMEDSVEWHCLPVGKDHLKLALEELR